ncbi:MAG: 3-dehydroquinate synthase [Candidatus Theseobacter exili]|nr:3-dehydroquinate synthase [Candidatus Theseobacter exili]
MKSISVDLGMSSYDIRIKNGLINNVGVYADSVGMSKSCALVSDRTVTRIYGERVEDSLRNAGFNVKKITVPDGEEAKTVLWLEKLWREFLEHGMDRTSWVLALGGGVVGDISGFAAATFMRGIKFIQVPTTLLAQVDASIGGKTSVNLPEGKNLVGAFHQPEAVLIDPDVLSTLDKGDFLSGIAEVIKYGVISDPELFGLLKNEIKNILALKEPFLTGIVCSSASIKAEVVSEDEKEGGRRAILNYGHTIGHAVEAACGYSGLTHGQAVAIGMIAAGRIAECMGFADSSEISLIESVIKDAGLPDRIPDVDVEVVMEHMKADKKSQNGILRFVLIRKIGEVFVTDEVTEKTVRDVVFSLM